MLPRQFSHMRWTDVLTFALFMVLASAIWFGHAMQSERNTYVPVMVSYTGVPGAIGLGGDGLPDTVMIEVRDAGKQLNAYKRDPLRLTIDLRPYIHGERGTIRVPSDVLRSSLSSLLHGTSQLIGTTPEELVCAYYTEQEKNVPICLNGELVPADEYQMVGAPILSRKSVKIYGQGQVLDRIDSISTESLQMRGLTDTTDTRVALQMPKGVRCGVDTIDVRIITERFTEKKVMLPLRVENVPDGYHLRLFPREVEVRIRVGFSHFGQVSASDVRAVCRYSHERTDKLNVELRYSNPYITAAWAYPSTVEFLLEQ
ncbi:MAG: YbbR-like domain-containing protein [Paludibacteraceae bacterium]|nr:YbbR-like domain-containing protein [Paludibacteraceae bacterium]